MSEKPTETTELNSWELTDSDQQLMSLQVTELGHLYVGDSCVAWSLHGASSRGTRICPCCMSCFLETIPCGGMSYSALMQGRWAWSCVKFICLALWVSGGLGVGRRWGKRTGEEGGKSVVGMQNKLRFKNKSRQPLQSALVGNCLRAHGDFQPIG